MSDESWPVFRVNGRYQLQPGGEMVGAVLQLDETLFEAFYYGFVVPGERSIGIIDIGADDDRGMRLEFMQRLERLVVPLFYAARKRIEIKPCRLGASVWANRQPMQPNPGFTRFVKELAARPKTPPRFRFCGGQIWCSCWYEDPLSHGHETITEVIEGRRTTIMIKYRHRFRWREYFEAQCQICGHWNRCGPLRCQGGGLLKIEGEEPDQFGVEEFVASEDGECLCAHLDCINPAARVRV